MAQIQLKRASKSVIQASNYVLAEGQPLWDKTSNLLYIGDGQTAVRELPAVYSSKVIGNNMELDGNNNHIDILNNSTFSIDPITNPIVGSKSSIIINSSLITGPSNNISLSNFTYVSNLLAANSVNVMSPVIYLNDSTISGKSQIILKGGTGTYMGSANEYERNCTMFIDDSVTLRMYRNSTNTDYTNKILGRCELSDYSDEAWSSTIFGHDYITGTSASNAQINGGVKTWLTICPESSFTYAKTYQNEHSTGNWANYTKVYFVTED